MIDHFNYTFEYSIHMLICMEAFKEEMICAIHKQLQVVVLFKTVIQTTKELKNKAL